MVTTVKIDDERKRALDEFVATIVVEGMPKMSLQELLGLMVDYSLENREELLKRVRKLPALEEDPAWTMLDQPDDWGVSDASEKIDEHLYGESSGSLR